MQQLWLILPSNFKLKKEQKRLTVVFRTHNYTMHLAGLAGVGRLHFGCLPSTFQFLVEQL